MKRLLTLFVLVLLASIAASAQKGSAPSGVQKDIEAIKKMETEINADFAKNKADAFNKYVHQNARVTLTNGDRTSRDAIGMMMTGGGLKITQVALSDMHVIVFIDTAIATYDTDKKAVMNGASFDGKTRWTNTWARINGNWTCIAIVGTPIRDMPPAK
jgi:ketosteroid isomerase-like protein